MKSIITLLAVALTMYSCSDRADPSTETKEKEEKSDTATTASQNEFEAGLLLGIGGEMSDNKTYWIRFTKEGYEIDSIAGIILTPQKDGFKVVAEVEHTHSEECEYEDYDGNQAMSNCTYHISKVTFGTPDNFRQKADEVKNNLKRLTADKFMCGLYDSEYESILYVGNGFIQYTDGGTSSECAPDGPGGGFEKDTIISMYGKEISPWIADYLDGQELEETYFALYEKTFHTTDIDSSKRDYFGMDEMPIYLGRNGGELCLYARNGRGRNLQDSWEEDVYVKRAPEQFQSISRPDIMEDVSRMIPDYKDYLLCPFRGFVGLIDSKSISFINFPDSQELGELRLNYGNVVMEEWVTPENMKRWGEAFQKAKGLSLPE